MITVFNDTEMKNLNLKDKKVADIISGSPMYKSHFSQYTDRVMPAMLLPNKAPLVDDIQKNHVAQIWVERDEKKPDEIIIVVKVDLNVRKE